MRVLSPCASTRTCNIPSDRTVINLSVFAEEKNTRHWGQPKGKRLTSPPELRAEGLPQSPRLFLLQPEPNPPHINAHLNPAPLARATSYYVLTFPLCKQISKIYIAQKPIGVNIHLRGCFMGLILDCHFFILSGNSDPNLATYTYIYKRNGNKQLLILWWGNTFYSKVFIFQARTATLNVLIVIGMF